MNVVDAAKILELFGDITPATVKKAYRKACSKYHPDRNPAGTEMMKAVNAAYESLKDYTGKIEQPVESANYGHELNEALNAIMGLSGIEIEVCGSWIWVTGKTKQYKDILGRDGAGYSYARKKKAWYFCPADSKTRGRGNWSLDRIRETHGSQRVRNSRKTLTAA